MYIKPEFRNTGIAEAFFEYIKIKYPYVKRFRLETEEDNIGVQRLYSREGFEELPYLQMILDK